MEVMREREDSRQLEGRVEIAPESPRSPNLLQFQWLPVF